MPAHSRANGNPKPTAAHLALGPRNGVPIAQARWGAPRGDERRERTESMAFAVLSGSFQRRALRHLGPFRDLVLEKGVEPFRRTADIAIAERDRLLPHVGQRQDALDVGVDL